MSKGVSERIEHQRKKIRQVKLQGLFQSRRELMESIPRQQAVSMLMPQLDAVRHFTVFQDNLQEFVRALQILVQITNKYQIVMTLIKKVQFQFTLANSKFGPQNHQISWIELFVFCLNNFRDEPAVAENCSYILMMCALQIRQLLAQNKALAQQSLLAVQLKRFQQGYPYQVLLSQHCQMVEYTLNLLRELLLSCQDGSFVYHLVCKMTPNIIILLNSLSQNERIISIHSIHQIFITSSLTVLFFVSHFNYIKFQQKQFQRLVATMKQTTLTMMIKCETQDQFISSCQSLKILNSIKGLSFSQKQFQELEEMIERELSFSRIVFFQSLKTILYNFKFLFRPNSVKMFFSKIFDPETISDKDIELKCILIDLITYQTINNGNKFKQQDEQAFISSWGEYTQVDRLLKLTSLLQSSQRGQKHLRPFFELLCQLMNWGKAQKLNTMVGFLQQELQSLLEYSQFKEILEQNNFKVL